MTIFRYEINNDKGYRLSVNKSNLIYFKRIVYEGFNIRYSADFLMDYEISSQLIRKLKIKKIDKQTNRIENTILELLERSKEIDINPNKFNSIYGSYSYSSNWSCSNSYSYYDNIDIEEKKEMKERNKYQSKIYSQKAKQYENKARFRK